MRRVAGLFLIATALWLIYLSCLPRLGHDPSAILAALPRALGDPRTLLPAAGGLLGVIGGLIIVCGGPGGAASAMIGGVLASGFAFYADPPIHVSHLRVWESDTLVSLTLLFLAGAAAVMARH